MLPIILFGVAASAFGKPCPHDTTQVYIPAGSFTYGSTREERECAYALDVRQCDTAAPVRVATYSADSGVYRK